MAKNELLNVFKRREIDTGWIKREGWPGPEVRATETI